MNRFAAIVCVIAACLPGALVCADPSSNPPPPQTRSAAPVLPLGPAEKYIFASPRMPLKDIQAMCDLTDDQAAKITGLQSATEKANADFQAANADKLKAAHDDMDSARKRNDSPAAARAAQKVRDLEKPMTDAWEKTRIDILALLTPLQVQAWRKAMILNSVKFTYDRAKLTADQLDKVGAIYDELAKQPGANFESINAKMSQKVPALLTDPQKQQMGLHAPSAAPANGK